MAGAAGDGGGELVVANCRVRLAWSRTLLRVRPSWSGGTVPSPPVPQVLEQTTAGNDISTRKMPPQGSTAVLFHRRSSRMFARLSQITRHLTCPAMPTPTCADPFKRPLRTAACLVIGTEILNGKTVDTNSAYFAKYCFSLGIELKRIEVVDDDEGDIVEAARRMSANYDFVVTSGGIGMRQSREANQAASLRAPAPSGGRAGCWLRRACVRVLSW